MSRAWEHTIDSLMPSVTPENKDHLWDVEAQKLRVESWRDARAYSPGCSRSAAKIDSARSRRAGGVVARDKYSLTRRDGPVFS